MSTGNNSTKLAVLVSGDGSNFQAIIDAIEVGDLDAQLSVVISNVASARALERGRKAGIHCISLPHTDFPSRAAFDEALAERLRDFQPDFVVLAGFMRILTPKFIDGFRHKLVNLHPSLLPRHPGLHTHRAALEAGDKEHGTSVHFVTEILDDGPIIGQAKLQIGNNDNELSLKRRIQVLEHRLYPQCLQLLATRALVNREGELFYLGKACSSPPLLIEES